VTAHLGRPLLIQRVLGKPILGPLVARAMTERAFARSFSSVFSTQHPMVRCHVAEHIRRRMPTAPVKPLPEVGW